MTFGRPGARPQSAGFALLMVLWALVPMALLFVTLAATARSDAQSADNLRTAAVLEAAADGAIYTAIFELLAGGEPIGDRRTIRMRGAAVSVETASLSGLVNPNSAPAELLAALLGRLGADAGTARFVASAIVDWRTPGQKARPGGAKAVEYRSAGFAYGPPGAPFESIDELGLVLGMTPPMLRALVPYLSLFAYGTPDPGLADPVLRAALRDIGVFRGGGPLATRVVQITAVALGGGPARLVRRAIVQIGRPVNGRRWRVLRWETVPGR